MTLGCSSGNAKGCNQRVGIAERTPEILDEVIRRIVKVAQPEQVILFGSTSRDETTPHSDIDLLIVKKPGSNRREYEQKIYRSLFGIMVPVDAIVVTTEDIVRYGDRIGTIIRPAVKEGRVVYDAHNRPDGP